MSLSDVSSRLKKALPGGQPAAKKELDLTEFYRLRAKMLGVLIADARLNAVRTVEEAARILNVSPAEFESWEFGDTAPSLPQLEILAFYFGIPVSHFWGQNTLKEAYDEGSHPEDEYIRLRNRMIGVMLRQARQDAGLSVEQVADDAKIPLEQLQRYEMGEVPVPMHELTILASALKQRMSYFLETSGHFGELLAMREEWKHFQELPEDLRQFAANPTNIGFIEIALMFSNMPTEKLRQIGSTMVDITL
ncbi:MAG: helix-turn-helix transcriptional regulator [Phototrophicaceae bacterium]